VSRAWPAPPEWMRLEVAPRRLRRGEAVTVTFTARTDELAARPYELGLACLAHYASTAKTDEVGDFGGRFRADVQALEHAEWHRLTDAALTLALQVPVDAPYSYEGDLLSFYWGVWVRVRERGLRPDAYVPLVVDP
jgi:hypothetical protein